MSVRVRVSNSNERSKVTDLLYLYNCQLGLGLVNLIMSSVVYTNPDPNPKRTWVIRSPRGAPLGDTIVGEGIREGTKGLLAAATAAALVINRVVNRVRSG